MSYSSNDATATTFQSINELLKKINNKALVLDFSHFSPASNPSKYDILVKLFGFPTAKEIYTKALEESSKGTDTWNSFQNKANVQLIKNYDSKNNVPMNIGNDKVDYSKPNLYENKSIELLEYSKITEIVTEPLGKKNFGNCMLFLSKDYGEAQSVLYVTLDAKINDLKYDENGNYDYKGKKSEITNPETKDVLEQIFSNLEELLINEMTHSLVEEVQNQATKSAIADILNRNQAHHIVAHISKRATLDKVINRLGLERNDLNGRYFSILDMVNKLNTYRDERSEFLASISGLRSSYTASLYMNVILPFIENTLVMDNIAANENFNYGEKNGIDNLKQNKLQIKTFYNSGHNSIKAYYKNKDKNSLEYNSENLPYYRIVDDENGTFYYTRELSEKDIQVSLPGPLGKHAFYSILENFIRNSAKHGEKVDTIKIQIDIIDIDDPNYVTVKLSDNCSKVSDDKLKDLLNGINTPILEKRMLGLSDMKICACLLEGQELTDDNCKKAIKVEKRDDGILQYTFKIAKPKKVIIISEQSDVKNIEKKEEGWFVYNNFDEFLEDNDLVKSFQFALIDEKVLNGEMLPNYIQTQLPNRVFIISENSVIKNLPKILFIEFKQDGNYISQETLLKMLWEKWNSYLNSNKVYQLYLTFQQNNDEKPTNIWENISGLNVHCKNKPIETIDNDKINIFYDRHGEIINNKKINLVNDNAWLLLDKNSKDFDEIFCADTQINPFLLPYSMVEAGLLKILIIDERIAEMAVQQMDSEYTKIIEGGFYTFSYQDSYKQSSLFNAAWACNIYTATHFGFYEESKPLRSFSDPSNYNGLKVSVKNIEPFQLNYQVNLHSLNHNCEKQSKSNPDGTSDLANTNYVWKRKDNSEKISTPVFENILLKPNILIVHRTILKAMYEKDKDIINKIKNHIPFIIMTTGGGGAHGVEGDFKLLPFSTLSEYISLKRISKFQLTRTIMELTTKKA